MDFNELRQLKYIPAYVSVLDDELDSLQAVTQGFEDDREYISRVSKSVSKLKSVIIAERDKTISQGKTLMAYIDSIDDAYIKNILVCRFINGLSWDAIAVKLTRGTCGGSTVRRSTERYLQKKS